VLLPQETEMDSAKMAATLLKTALKMIEDSATVHENIRRPYLDAAHMMISESRQLILAASQTNRPKTPSLVT
jgi:hypothetical protein